MKCNHNKALGHCMKHTSKKFTTTYSLHRRQSQASLLPLDTSKQLTPYHINNFLMHKHLYSICFPVCPSISELITHMITLHSLSEAHSNINQQCLLTRYCCVYTIVYYRLFSLMSTPDIYVKKKRYGRKRHYTFDACIISFPVRHLLCFRYIAHEEISFADSI